MEVWQSLGDALNGIFQVVCDFFNLLASIVPNPDPFPQMINNLPSDTLEPFGFSVYWMDKFIGLQFMRDVITVWMTMNVLGLTFAIIYWGVKLVKP